MCGQSVECLPLARNREGRRTSEGWLALILHSRGIGMTWVDMPVANTRATVVAQTPGHAQPHGCSATVACSAPSSVHFVWDSGLENSAMGLHKALRLLKRGLGRHGRFVDAVSYTDPSTVRCRSLNHIMFTTKRKVEYTVVRQRSTEFYRDALRCLRTAETQRPRRNIV